LGSVDYTKWQKLQSGSFKINVMTASCHEHLRHLLVTTS
jgi:hypothetical protein